MLILSFLCQDGDGGDIINEVMKIIVIIGVIMYDPAREILKDLHVPRACALQMGLIYAQPQLPKRAEKHAWGISKDII